MKGRDDLDKFFGYISKTLENGEKGQDFPEYFYNSYSAGDNKLYQKNISETKKFDDEWIKTVESYFPSLDKITKNPKSFIKYEEEITDIERAKKINSSSVRHLASHTHFIRDVEEGGTVVPKKILTSHSELDFEIYENRFIFTLINRLYLFVKNRYEVIKNNVESFQKDHLNTTSDFKIEGTDVTVSIDLVVKKDLDNKRINSHNYKLLARVEKLNELVSGLKGCQFMHMMAKCKVVRPPIMKTNIILKNPEFKNAYLLWLFLDRYNTLGYDVDVKEKDLTFDPKFQKDLERLVMLSYTTVLGNQEIRKETYNAIGYEEYTKKKTKIVKTNAQDLVENPDLIQVEDNSVNEYFLMKYRKLFAESVTDFEEDGKISTDSAMRKAIRQATDIVNGIFESVFEIQEETDVFKLLIKDEDLDKSRDEKRNQLKYAKMIREVKEVDYNSGIRREKRILKELIDINNKIIRRDLISKQEESRQKRRDLYDKTIGEMRKENEEYAKRIKELENLNKLKEEEKNALQIEREKATIRLKEEIEILKQKEKELIAKEKAEFEEAKAIEKERLIELKRREKEAVAARKVFFAQKLEEEKANNEAELERTRKEYDDNLNKLLSEIEEEKQKFSEEMKLEEENILQERIDLENEQARLAEEMQAAHSSVIMNLEETQNKVLTETREEKEAQEKQMQRERIAVQKVKKYEENLYLASVAEEKARQDAIRNEEISRYEKEINNIKETAREEYNKSTEEMLKEQFAHDEEIDRMRAEYEAQILEMKTSFEKEREEYLKRLEEEKLKEQTIKDEQTAKINELTSKNDSLYEQRLAALRKEKEDLILEINEKQKAEQMQRTLELAAIEKVRAYEQTKYEEQLKAIALERERIQKEALEKEKAEIEDIKKKEEERKRALLELEKKRALETKRLEKEREEALRKEKEALLEKERLEKEKEKEKLRLEKILQKKREDEAIAKVKAYEEKKKKMA